MCDTGSSGTPTATVASLSATLAAMKRQRMLLSFDPTVNGFCRVTRGSSVASTGTSGSTVCPVGSRVIWPPLLCRTNA